MRILGFYIFESAFIKKAKPFINFMPKKHNQQHQVKVSTNFSPKNKQTNNKILSQKGSL
jgi:hypothetical protein